MGRKQQQKERRLIKGFNIGMVENANFSLSSSAGNKAADFFSGILLGKRKQSSKKKVMNVHVGVFARISGRSLIARKLQI